MRSALARDTSVSRNAPAPRTRDRTRTAGSAHGLLDAHLDTPVEHRENFLVNIDVPMIRRVGPVQARGDAAHIGDVEGAPRTGRAELLAPDDLHGDALMFASPRRWARYSAIGAMYTISPENLPLSGAQTK